MTSIQAQGQTQGQTQGQNQGQTAAPAQAAPPATQGPAFLEITRL